MKKIIAVLIVAIVSVSSVFALTPDKNWMKENKDALGVGLDLGFPGAGVAVYYRNKDNNNRITGVVHFNYFGGLGIGIDAMYQYAIPVKVGSGRYADQGMWNLDISPLVGVGTHIPIGEGYFSLAINVGVKFSCDLPYKDCPVTPYFKFVWRPRLEFGNSSLFQAAGYYGSIGATWNFDLK